MAAWTLPGPAVWLMLLDGSDFDATAGGGSGIGATAQAAILLAAGVLVWTLLAWGLAVTATAALGRLPGAPGRLGRVGPNWLLLTEAQGRDALIALSAMTAIEGLTASTGREITGVARRLDLRHALRGLVRDRAPVTVALTGWAGGVPVAGQPQAGFGTEVTGTIDRVGADFIEVASHAAWEPRRASTIRSVALVPLAALMVVRALPLG